MSDLVVHNARVRTLDPANPTAEAVLVRGGQIAAVGSDADVLAQAVGVRRFDAGGRTVLPGLIDSHVHFWRSGLVEQMLDLRQTRSLPEVMAKIRELASGAPRGSLLMARGFMDTQMAEHRYPTRAEMDAAAPDHILWIFHNNGHSCAVNSNAIRFLDLDPRTEGVELDAEGQPTGTLRGLIAFESQRRLLTLLDPATSVRCLEIISEQAVRQGATTIHCLEGGRLEGDPDVRDFLAHQAELPVNTVLYYQITDVEKILGMGLPRIGGCVLIDGSPAAHTGALFEPYSDRPDTIGPTFWEQADLDAWVWAAHSAGLQITVHATCERAINQMLSALERALTRLPRPDHRHRIDHAYFPRLEDVRRAARLGVTSGVQPYFEQAFRQMYHQRLGEERQHRVHPYRSYLDAGVLIGGGSDSFVTPIDPIAGIHAAVNHGVPEQRVTPDEALRMFTLNNARLAFEEGECGTIERGKRGDLVVLSGDPLAVDPGAIGEIQVEATVVRGQVVYER